MLSSEFQPGDVMESKPQTLCSPFPCPAANGRRGPKQPSSSSETGTSQDVSLHANGVTLENHDLDGSEANVSSIRS